MGCVVVAFFVWLGFFRVRKGVGGRQYLLIWEAVLQQVISLFILILLTMFNELLYLFVFYSKMFKPTLIGEASKTTAQEDDVSGSNSTPSHPESHR